VSRNERKSRNIEGRDCGAARFYGAGHLTFTSTVAVVALSQTGEKLYSRYLQNEKPYQLTKLVCRGIRSSVLKWNSEVSN